MAFAGLFLLQMASPGIAFCSKEGMRVIQCKSVLSSASSDMVEKTETGCCNKPCNDKPSVEVRNHFLPLENENSTCCISADGNHDGAVCPSFSSFQLPAIAYFFEHVEPVIVSKDRTTLTRPEKPTSLLSIRSVVLIR